MYAVGKVLKPRGLKGEVKVEIITSFPAHFESLHTVYFQNKKGWHPLTVSKVSFKKNAVYLIFKEVASLEEAEKLRGSYLYIPKDDLIELEEDEFYVHDLIGMRVVDEAGHDLGEIVNVESYAGNDVYVIENLHGRQQLIPAIKDVVLKVDRRLKRMTIHVIDGLLD